MHYELVWPYHATSHHIYSLTDGSASEPPPPPRNNNLLGAKMTGNVEMTTVVLNQDDVEMITDELNQEQTELETRTGVADKGKGMTINYK